MERVHLPLCHPEHPPQIVPGCEKGPSVLFDVETAARTINNKEWLLN